jgi:hypothetical protein
MEFVVIFVVISVLIAPNIVKLNVSIENVQTVADKNVMFLLVIKGVKKL